MKFIGRKRELQALEHFYNTPEAGLMILFGRRRVGKTSLLTHFIENQRLVHNQEVTGGFYWMATTHNEAYQLRDFSQALIRFDPRFRTVPSPDFTFPDWEAAFNHLADAVSQMDTPQLVVIDEFTYLVRNNPALTSLIQKLWDHRLSKIDRLRLVLTGSLVGMMEREVISYQAPLYGRATSLLRLRPLPYASLIELFPDRAADERVAIYAATGGVPAYLNLFTRTGSFVTALQRECLIPGSIMLGDPAVMLHEQLKEPQSFESILSSMANGYHKWGEIAKMAGVTETSLGHYLRILEELELIERRDPIFANPEGKKGQYYIRDHFMQFYYRFLVPHLSKIDRGYLDVVVDQIYQDLRSFIGTYVFEELCREWTLAAGAAGQLSFDPEDVGSYWQQYRGQGVQLDVVAVNQRQKKLLIGECKWGKDTISRSILTDLIQRSQRMPQVSEGWQVQYALFSREGFTAAAQALARELGVQLVTLNDMEKTFLAVYER
jgi:AAA+ ATPase superfamily predicted ATPase